MKPSNTRHTLFPFWLCVAVLIGCGTSIQQAPSPSPSQLAASKNQKPLPADFARRECALYEKMDPRQRACTIKTNAEAGRRWLETVSGKSLGELSLTDQLSLAQQTLRASTTLTATELADVGWFVAETLGGRYRWDASSAQVVLDLGSAPEPIAPMTLVQQIRGGDRDLTHLPSLDSGHRPPADRVDCKGVERIDVLQHRLTWTEDRQ